VLFLGLILSYLVGSIPIGILISKRYSSIDIRKAGSGNIGATNVARVVGKKAGFITLIGDMAKGALPVLTFLIFVGADTWQKQTIVALAGFCAFLGHLFPVFLKFKGGKGVATATGIFLILSPTAVLVATLIFFIVVWLWRYVSLASLSASISMPILIGLFTDKKVYVFLAIAISLLIFYKHKDNIKRLLSGTENKFK